MFLWCSGIINPGGDCYLTSPPMVEGGGGNGHSALVFITKKNPFLGNTLNPVRTGFALYSKNLKTTHT